MLTTDVSCIDTLWSGCRSLAANEDGSVVVELGFFSVVFGLLITGMIGFGSVFSQELSDDLGDLRGLLDEWG